MFLHSLLIPSFLFPSRFLNDLCPIFWSMSNVLIYVQCFDLCPMFCSISNVQICMKCFLYNVIICAHALPLVPLTCPLTPPLPTDPLKATQVHSSPLVLPSPPPLIRAGLISMDWLQTFSVIAQPLPLWPVSHAGTRTVRQRIVPHYGNMKSARYLNWWQWWPI